MDQLLTAPQSLAVEPELKVPVHMRHWFEPATVILMALTTLATVWCSYQSSRWSGQSTTYQAQGDKAQREAMVMHMESNQLEMVQSNLFMNMINARLTGNEKLATFYTDRFSPELKQAYGKWLALKPFENAGAPPHPFVPGLYAPRLQKQTESFLNEAMSAQSQAKTSAERAGSYLSNTVLLAAVLFFAGTAGKFHERRVRLGSLALAIVFFAYAVIRILILPVG